METTKKHALTDVKVGDRVGRQIGPKDSESSIWWLTVTDVEDGTIFCNDWMFDVETGAEIDHELKWGPEYGKTGSHIRFILPGVADE